MPNPENVIGKGRPFKSDDELSKAAQRRGGVNSGIARRAKRDAKSIANFVLALQPELTDKMLANVKRMGVKKSARLDTKLIATLAAMQKAMNGDIRCYKFVLDLAGETTESAIEQIHLMQEQRQLMPEELTATDDAAMLHTALDEMTDEELAAYEQFCSVFGAREEGGQNGGTDE